MTLQEEINQNTANRTEENNPQVLFHKYKLEIVKEARTRAKQAIPKMNIMLNKLQLDLNNILNNQNTSEENKILNSMPIQEAIQTLEKKRHSNIRIQTET
jgi:ATP-dependent Clp protease ATP-binding subunit ClpA